MSGPRRRPARAEANPAHASDSHASPGHSSASLLLPALVAVAEEAGISPGYVYLRRAVGALLSSESSRKDARQAKATAGSRAAKERRIGRLVAKLPEIERRLAIQKQAAVAKWLRMSPNTLRKLLREAKERGLAPHK